MYLVAVLFAAFVCFSCSDDDKEDEELTGAWNYKSAEDVYLELTCVDDKITITPELLQLIPEDLLNQIPEEIKKVILAGGIPVTMVKPVLASYAGQQMKKYFRGINFISDTELEILITTADSKEQKISTTYKVQGSILQVSTQSNDFKEITNNMIPEAMASIDLNYFFKDGKLTLYLNTTYVKTIISMLPTILVATGTISADQLITVQTEVQKISNQITKLEIGATLKR